MATNGTGEPLIRVRELSVAFEGRAVLEGVDLDIHRGEILAIVGASGTGKSVLVRSVLGLVAPRTGPVEAFGERVGPQGPTVEMEKRWGVLFQFGALFSALTVAQNVEIPMREFLDLPGRLVRSLARLKVELVGLAETDGDKYPAELSGGMIKRAALARALALDPEILFLDEPTAGLDPIAASGFDALIADLRKTLGLTVVMVTHDLDTLHSIVDRIVVVGEKRVLVEGDLETMRRFDHPWVKSYFNGERARAAFG
jgi:phospholipid/cholesterol/gamma-HCH transport system ATP-binding protein